MLVDHGQSGLDCVTGSGDVCWLPGQEHLSLVLVVEPVEDLHQGAFPGAVFAEQCVDLPGLDVEVHRVVGQHPWEPFGDPVES